MTCHPLSKSFFWVVWKPVWNRFKTHLVSRSVIQCYRKELHIEWSALFWPVASLESSYFQTCAFERGGLRAGCGRFCWFRLLFATELCLGTLEFESKPESANQTLSAFLQLKGRDWAIGRTCGSSRSMWLVRVPCTKHGGARAGYVSLSSFGLWKKPDDGPEVKAWKTHLAHLQKLLHACRRRRKFLSPGRFRGLDQRGLDQLGFKIKWKILQFKNNLKLILNKNKIFNSISN